MNTISTHALDTSTGKPAAGMPLTLEVLSGSDWNQMSSAVTNEDGRVKDLLPAGTKLAAGTYKMRFDTGAYFKKSGTTGFYPHVEVVFQIRGAGEHYHIPLLISPYGYSTYRGS